MAGKDSYLRKPSPDILSEKIIERKCLTCEKTIYVLSPFIRMCNTCKAR